MKNLGFKKKLQYVLGGSILALALIVGMGLFSFFNISSKTKELAIEHFEPLIENDIATQTKYRASIEKILNADRDAHQALIAEREAINARTDEVFDKAYQDNLDNIQQTLERVRLAGKNFPKDMLPELEKFEALFKAWKEEATETMNLAMVDRKPEALKNTYQHGADSFKAMRKQIDNMTVQLEQRIEEKKSEIEQKKTNVFALSESIQKGINSTIIWFLIIGFASILCIVLFGKKSLDTVIQNINSIKESAVALSQGRFKEVKGLVAKDELLDLANALNGTQKIITDSEKLVAEVNEQKIAADKQVEILKKLPIPIVEVGRDFEILSTNDIAEEFSSEDHKLSRGQKSFEEFKTQINRSTDIKAQILSGKLVEEQTILYKKGIATPVNYTGFPVFSTQGEVVGAIEIFLDQSDVYRVAKKLAATVESLETVSNTLDEASSELNGKSTNLQNESDSIAAAAEQVSANVNNVANSVEETTANFNNMASVSEQMSIGVSTVASAIEELNASFSEITDSTSRATTVATETLKSSEEVSSSMEELQQAATNIQEVVKMIGEIARQTNMLALNATIESARAGEAGKGFAVVAGEVKDLAMQTAASTKDIAEHVETIQKLTGVTSGKMKTVIKTAIDIRDQSQSIASSVTEQSSTAREIARTIQESAQAATEVSRNAEEGSNLMQSVNRATQESAEGVKQISVGINSVNEAGTAVNTGAKDIQQLSFNVKSELTQLRTMLGGFSLLKDYDEAA